MATNPEISRQLDLQRRVFRVATDPMRYGLTLKVIAFDSGIPDSTLRTYADGSTAMPLYAFVKLCGVLPDELLSLFLSPADRAVVTVTGGTCPDTFARHCIDYTSTLAAARHPDSPAGVDLDLTERADLAASQARVRAVS